ncbi:MAG: aminotransferase class I/II-fold pyridoxal phosphate-dependent enzyme [Kineosporiaceae bacterium]|nr:aminotransferase class I/II-fold pyridoxal phosphate-dependent enzyme [Kineosporiaceae bacterium]
MAWHLDDIDLPDWELDDAELRDARSVKWTLPGPDVLPAWVAEMDVRPARVVRAALDDALERGILGYPAEDRLNGLPEATAGFVERRFGLLVDPARVISCGDVMAGVRLALEVLCERAPVVVPTPAYPPFLQIPAVTGRELITVACQGRELDVEAIGAALAAGGRTVLLSSPHNPLGRAFTEPELAALRDVVLAHGARVISDEIHAPLVLDGARHLPYSAIEGTADHVTTVLAASKAFNVPGLKCAQIIAGNDTDLTALRAAPLVSNHGTSPLGIVATVAAYTDGDGWLDGLLADLSARRDQFGALLAQHLPEVDWTPMQATYLAWLDARSTGLADPSATALATAKVMVHPGRLFGTGFEGFARVNLATSPQRLERIVLALAEAWNPPS